MEDPWFEVGKVEVFSALSLWKNEIEEEEETKPGVEWEPAYYEEGPGFSEEGQSEDDKVDEPWCYLSWVTESKGFVGEVAWQENCRSGADQSLVSVPIPFWGAHAMKSAMIPNMVDLVLSACSCGTAYHSSAVAVYSRRKERRVRKSLYCVQIVPDHESRVQSVNIDV